ncbi:MAG: DNA polymerase III subunit beta [Patescibacteria group bacterium]|nr:DNA polymerase III subunit beta [Patescibacteria group bacterium]MDE2588743.1 DNA polymerase III subunit beta [Patescibacteria group bacterium]
MKLSVLAGNIQKKLTLVNHAISSRTQLPILGTILLETHGDSLMLSATDLEIGIQATIPAQVEIQGATTVPAKLFTELINSLPEEKITLELVEGSLKVLSKKTNSVLQTQNRDEFPTLYEEKGIEMFKMKTDLLRNDLGMVVFSASIEATRPALSGVLLRKNTQGLLFVATDGYRLSLKSNIHPEEDAQKIEKDMLIPARVVREAVALKESGDVSIFISEHNNQIIFSQDDIVLVGRLIEAQFPQYEKIIPTDVSAKITFDREELLKAVKTCAIFARETANVIKFSLQKDKVVVSAKTPSLGENTVEVEATLTGEENEIAFNSRYVLDVLGNVDTEEMTFEMTGPLNPGVFRISGDTSFLHLIMPIRL